MYLEIAESTTLSLAQYLAATEPGSLSPVELHASLRQRKITVAGEVLEHRLFHFRLPVTCWCQVEVEGGSLWRKEFCGALTRPAERPGGLWEIAGVK